MKKKAPITDLTADKDKFDAVLKRLIQTKPTPYREIVNSRKKKK
jgi:hypothetical protein